MIRRFALFLCLLFVVACGSEKLQDAGAHLELAPQELDFAGVLLHRTAGRTLQVRNVGVSPATLSLVEAPAGFRVEPAQLLVQSGTLEELQVIFNPETAGTFEGRLVFSAESQGLLEVAVRGEGTAQAVDTEPVLDFGAVRLGSEKTLPLDVASLTEVDLGVSLEFSGTDAEAFGTSTGRLSLPPRGTGRLFVRFAPTVRGPLAARMILKPCSSCADVIVQLKGEGTGEEASVQPSPLDFGVLTPGMSIRREVRVTNRGDVGTWLVDAELLRAPGAPLRLVEQAFPVAVDQASTILEVDFAPEVAGRWDATLRLVVAGRAIDIPVIARAERPVLRVQPEAVDFGVSLPNRPERRMLLLENLTGTPVTIDRLELEGAPVQPFRVRGVPALPFELGTTPLELDLEFSAAAPTEASGVLLVGVESRPDSSLRVPLTGRAVEAESACAIAMPEALRFGLVPVGEVARRSITLRNEAAATCWIWALGLEGSDAFRWVDPPAEALSLPAGGTLQLEVEYAPQLPRLEGEAAELRFEMLDEATPAASIPLRAAAASLEVSVTPRRVSFGTRAVGSHAVAAVALRNDGRLPVPISAIRLEAPAAFSLLATSAGDVLAAGETAVVQLRWAPDQAGSAEGELAISFAGAAEPLLVPMDGEAHAGPCTDCGLPVAACPPAQWAHLPASIDLVGAGTDPGGSEVDCTWTVASAPAGSAVDSLPAVGACGGRLEPDLPGRYELLLEVAGGAGSATCTTSVDLFPAPGLSVSASWQAAVDLDLHLFHPDAGSPAVPATWFSLPGDCSPYNPAPAWDGPGDGDDPILLENAVGPGREVIRIEAPVAGTRYGVGLHYHATMSGLVPADASIGIRCSGDEIATFPVALQALGEGAFVGTVEWQADGSCSFTPASSVVQVEP